MYFSTQFSGIYRSPTNGNNEGPGKQNSSFKSSNDRLPNTGKLCSREPPICFAFNQYEQAFCELPHNQCQYKRLHKCQTCGHWGCKSRNHSQHRPTSRPQAHVTTDDTEIFDVPIPHTPVPAPSPSVESNSDPDMQQMFNKFMQSMITSHMAKVEGQPQASSHISGPDPTQAQVYIRNLVKLMACLLLPTQIIYLCPDYCLRKKHFVDSHHICRGSRCPPLDTYCSLSLVSKAHFDIVCQKYPSVQFTQLETPLPVAVAAPESQLSAIGILQVPIVWETGKPCTFSMLAVPQWVWRKNMY